MKCTPQGTRPHTAEEAAELQRAIAGLPPTATDAEVAAALTAKAQAAAITAGIEGIYAPVPYNGKMYPADEKSLAKYEMAKQSRGRGKMAKGIAFATDGSILKLSTPAAIDAFHAAIEDAVNARVAAIHDAI